MEAFLLRAKIVDIREAGGGVTGSQRATLTDGVFTHDVHIQSVGQYALDARPLDPGQAFDATLGGAAVEAQHGG